MPTPRSELEVAGGLLLVGWSCYAALEQLLLSRPMGGWTILGGELPGALGTSLAFALGTFVAANGLFRGIRGAVEGE
ncbi:hypothetical protein SAMN04487949_0529 [Halogranum gelatinilyticum]|uniref:Uncharacterized protein n=1 Tax=Halogranum gelatinilyticum TaxID=660521 RepID=A0A1G9PTM7_9EURY|nr:hypothetical protein [Halogranum gelatinilyticum]SDM02116.1 hypothetical protein SAMN04487949_0529 [Halogranum gelatinilyticum]